jgi:hypothetical protein
MPKLIKQIHDLIDYVADKPHTAPQRRHEIDQAVYEASVSLFNEYLAQYEATSTIHEYLAPFELSTDFASGGKIGPGLFQKPSDYVRYTMIRTTTGIKVQVINNAMWANRSNDAVEGPEEDYPIARLGLDTIEVLPDTVDIEMHYLKIPTVPVYFTDTQGNYDDTSSTDVEWNPTLFHKLANQACGKLGINLRDQQIIVYSEQQQQKGD